MKHMKRKEKSKTHILVKGNSSKNPGPRNERRHHKNAKEGTKRIVKEEAEKREEILKRVSAQGLGGKYLLCPECGSQMPRNKMESQRHFQVTHGIEFSEKEAIQLIGGSERREYYFGDYWSHHPYGEPIPREVLGGAPGLGKRR